MISSDSLTYSLTYLFIFLLLKIFGQGNNISISTPSDSQISLSSPIKNHQTNPLSPHIRSPFHTSKNHQTTTGRWLDIDEIMKSRCLSGYSIDSGKNIQVFYLILICSHSF